ncbi:MAG: class I SAM-dependent methyltransferase [Defluviitaleaceae bacterium]|nr:class I SAM-dependent methyltransferase [Defluviitaleaceae bacterium]
MKNLYDEVYFERGIENNLSCYSNYRWMPELTIPLAARIIEYLKISENDTVLDFGCAKGYLVYALRLLHREAYGYDISEYALSKAPVEIKEYVGNELDGHYTWIISKDVFEHISYEEIETVLKKLSNMCDNIFCVVPLGRNGTFNIPYYESDMTHIIREDLDWWCQMFQKSNFEIIESTYSVKYIKKNWSKWDDGNGFFILRSIV